MYGNSAYAQPYVHKKYNNTDKSILNSKSNLREYKYMGSFYQLYCFVSLNPFYETIWIHALKAIIFCCKRFKSIFSSNLKDLNNAKFKYYLVHTKLFYILSGWLYFYIK